MTSRAANRFVLEAGRMFVGTLCASAVALGHDSERSTHVVTSTNDPGKNQVVRGCTKPDSIALSENPLFVAGATQ